jgi:hypothetical protein
LGRNNNLVFVVGFFFRSVQNPDLWNSCRHACRPRSAGCTCIQRVILKRYLLSRNALRLLKIIQPYLVEQERMANAQFLRCGSKYLGQNFFFYCVCLDRSFTEEPSLPRTGYFKTVATIQLVRCFRNSAVPTDNGWVTALVKRY